MNDKMLSDFIGAITEFAKCVVGRLGEQVESILYYPHPFHMGGVVIVLRDDSEPFLEFTSEVFSCTRMNVSLHCLRHAELFKLSLPGIFVMPNPVSEHLHLAQWLKHKGVVIYGRDLRDEIAPPINQHLWLDAHIEACQHCVRPGFILAFLMDKSYAVLIDEMNRQVRYLMATALLTHGIWDVSMETIPARFESKYADEQITEITRKLAALYQVDPANEYASRRAAYESVWLFESFLRRLRRCGL